MSEFSIDISDIVSAIEEEEKDIAKTVGLVTGKIGLEIIRNVVIPNPVDTGRSRAGWLMSRGEPSGYAPPPGEYDKAEGEAAVSAILGKAAGVAASGKGFDTVIVENNVEYVAYLNASHPVAAGFVDIAVANAISMGDK